MKKYSLARGLKEKHIRLITLGGIIGSCYFLGSGYLIQETGPGAILSYLLGGLIVVSVMYCLGELTVAHKDNSFIGYKAKYISPTWATGVGWSYWLTWVTYVPSEMIAAGIIMNTFFPQISSVIWAIFFGALITCINLLHVSSFGELEYWLAYIKITAIVGFTILAIAIFLGLMGSHHHFVGTSVLKDNGGFFPKGVLSIFLTMVVVLVNFQGSEIIGITAAESKDPEKSIPAAIKAVTVRIVLLYIVPILMLVVIFPWNKAGLSQTVFADALQHYGLKTVAGCFAFVILTAAISTSNSGLYSCVRALYTMGMGRMAPSYFMKLNDNKVPKRATIFSILICWVFVIIYTFDRSEFMYKYLLALSGFSGSIAWISICWTQYRFRKKMIMENKLETLKFKTPWFPYLTLASIWVQISCLVVMVFTPALRASLYVGIPALILPMIIYKAKGVFKSKKEHRYKVYRPSISPLTPTSV